ncbi:MULTISPECIES: PHP domain-containing protein [Clostridia]|uniref:PHP domain-containing protein n=1 Tax=Clostridia TaxID=186801 RepID=UPI000EA294F8|nr:MULTISPECIES: PHP domain-containing protein [Clostridia]NBJ69455.1 PHP domain-containing protein [Roseburia sp. 1XD42-34]RKI78530.1 PHP domain-containing protein [Clostridium sp. 1xD42-85]
MKADLHVHSTYSDGSDHVEMVLAQANQRGVTQISFVDHDSIDGLKEKQSLGESYGIEVIPGIEISAYDFKRNRKVHLLGYDYHPEAKNIAAICQTVRCRRQAHTLWQIEQLNQHGYSIDPQAVIRAARPSETIYKQHVMQQIMLAPYASSAYQELYRKLFKGEGPAAGDIEYVDAFLAVEAIVADGGIAVVAHPGQLNSYDIISELVEVGLGGVERNHPDHTAEDHQRVEALAKKYELVMTGGSDYHGSFGAPVEIGAITSPAFMYYRKV